MPLERIEANYSGEVATRYRYIRKRRGNRYYFIGNRFFCLSCTRARISAEGKLYTCLFASKGNDLRNCFVLNIQMRTLQM
ncbi:hypothetical protein ACT7DZ_38200 [Bacillus cereus]